MCSRTDISVSTNTGKLKREITNIQKKPWVVKSDVPLSVLASTRAPSTAVMTDYITCVIRSVKQIKDRKKDFAAGWYHFLCVG